MKSLLIPSLIGAIISFTIFMVFSFLNYKKRYSVTYNLKNMFPYELNYESSFKDNLIGNVFLLLSSASLVLFFISFFQSMNNYGLTLMSLIAGVLASVMMPFVVFVPVKILKTHLFVDVLFFLTTFLTLGSFGLVMVNEYQLFMQTKSLVMAIIDLTFAFLVFLILMNPKLTHWGDLEEVTNSDGTKYYKRPKYFVLAFSEWLIMFFMLLSPILGLITFYMM